MIRTREYYLNMAAVSAAVYISDICILKAMTSHAAAAAARPLIARLQRANLEQLLETAVVSGTRMPGAGACLCVAH